jgi:D-psicose/D-tagatose/L-ribulose 3-epimerase
MKFGAHSFIFTDRWTDQTLGILAEAKTLGLDCFEIGVGDDVEFTPALTRRRAEAAGLELFASPGGLWPYECDLSLEDPRQRAAGLAFHLRQVDTAAELGATAYTGALYGHPGAVQRRPPRSAELTWTAEGLFKLAEYARARGVRIVLEPMSHFRTHLVNRPEQALALLVLANHPNLSILLDTYHMACEVRDYGAAIRAAGPHLWGLHACENDRGAPGSGHIAWDEVVDACRAINYQGPAVIESFTLAVKSIARAAAIWRPLAPTQDGLAQDGLKFLRAKF